jgi:hypothetical protein
MANQADFVVKSGLVVKATTTVPSKEQLVTTNVVRTASRPTLDINFTRSNTLDPRVTFSRNSISTYVGSDGYIKYAQPNQAKIDYDPITGQSKGLLLEEQRTNIAAYGSDVGNVISWAQQYGIPGTGAITQNYTTAPDGSNNAAFLYHTTSTPTYKNIAQGVLISTNTNYTFSIWAKTNGEPVIGITHFDTYTNLNSYYSGYRWATDAFDTPTITGSSETSVVSPSRDIYPNGWIRIKYTVNFPSGPSRYVYFKWELDSSTAAANRGLYLWGSQVEAGTNASTYIPTAGSQITRLTDTADLIGSNFTSWYNQAEGTVLIDQIPYPNMPYGGVLTIGDGTANNCLHIWESGQQLIAEIFSSSISYGSGLGYFTLNSGKFALAVKPGNYAEAFNGSVQSGTNNFQQPLVDRVYIGRSRFNGLLFNGWVKRLTYYPQRLPNATLSTLTS